MCTCVCLMSCPDTSGEHVVFSRCEGLLLFGLYSGSGYVLVSGFVHVKFGKPELSFLVCVHGGKSSVCGLWC